jgi:hypothetical protein
VLLELSNVPADDRTGHSQPTRGDAKIAGTHYTDEGFHQAQMVHDDCQILCNNLMPIMWLFQSTPCCNMRAKLGARG